MTSSQLYPVELFDETLDINATDNYDITVEMSVEGISIALLDLLRSKYVMFRHYPVTRAEEKGDNLYEEVISSDEFLQKRYRKTILITPTPESTLVPTPLYDPQLKEDYFRFNLTGSHSGNIYSNSAPFPGATVLFSLPGALAETISEKWPGITPWHHSRTLLQHINTSNRSSDERYVHMYIMKDFVTIFIIEKKKLIFFNSFKCTTPSDISYFLFNVFEKAGIKSTETLFLSGSVEPYGELHISLLNFCENIKFDKPIIRHSFSYVMNNLPMHRWLNLFTASSCE